MTSVRFSCVVAGVSLVACGGRFAGQADASGDGASADATGADAAGGDAASDDAASDAAPDGPPPCDWDAETVGTSADPSRPVIAATPDGGVHILFADPTVCHTLRYATKPAGATTWTVTALDSNIGQDAQYFSLISDATGNLHASYFAGTVVKGCPPHAPTVRYGEKPAGGNWGVFQIATPATGGQESSLALDGSEVHVVYDGDVTLRTLQYAHGSANSWTVESVPSADPIASFPSIRIDAAHRAHVSVMGESAGVGMVYAERSATGTWSTTTIDTTASGTSSIDVDPADGVHIAYEDEGQLAMRYAYRPAGGSWTTTPIDTDHVMAHVTLRIDSTGTLHLVYIGGSPFNGIPLHVRHAHAVVGGPWTIEPIGPDPPTLKTTLFGAAAALDVHDALHIVYARSNDAGTWDVRYMHRVCR